MENNNDYNVSFLPAAHNDISEIISSFVMLGSRQGAVRIRDAIIKASERVASFPYCGTRISDEKLAKFNFHMIVVEKYLMFYRVFDDTKTVLFYRVLNGKRDYPSVLQSYFDEYK